MKLLQITDLHLVPSGGELRGLDPEARLRECLADIEKYHADADVLVVTGDVADQANPLAYELFWRIVEDYRLPPLHVTVGNHDRRDVFSQFFPASIDAGTGFAQTVVDLGEHVGILLDTWEYGKHSGTMCEARLRWLQATLAADDRPALLFMHHHPFKVGLKRPDQIAMLTDAALWATLEPFRHRIRHIFCGHLHRNVAGSWHGIPFSILAGITQQATLNFETALVEHTVSDPYYGVILVDADTVVMHPKQVRDWQVTQAQPSPGPSHG